MLLGGGMANTFLRAQGYSLGDSLLDDSHLDFARDFSRRAQAAGVAVELPADLIVAPAARSGSHPETRAVAPGDVPEGWQALDIGPRTVERFVQLIAGSRTVFWNGPLGLAEEPEFAHGSEDVARAIAQPGLISVVGGGDTLAVLDRTGLTGQVTHASTGGGRPSSSWKAENCQGLPY